MDRPPQGWPHVDDYVVEDPDLDPEVCDPRHCFIPPSLARERTSVPEMWEGRVRGSGAGEAGVEVEAEETTDVAFILYFVRAPLCPPLSLTECSDATGDAQPGQTKWSRRIAGLSRRREKEP